MEELTHLTLVYLPSNNAAFAIHPSPITAWTYQGEMYLVSAIEFYHVFNLSIFKLTEFSFFCRRMPESEKENELCFTDQIVMKVKV